MRGAPAVSTHEDIGPRGEEPVRLAHLLKGVPQDRLPWRPGRRLAVLGPGHVRVHLAQRDRPFVLRDAAPVPGVGGPVLRLHEVRLHRLRRRRLERRLEGGVPQSREDQRERCGAGASSWQVGGLAGRGGRCCPPIASLRRAAPPEELAAFRGPAHGMAACAATPRLVPGPHHQNHPPTASQHCARRQHGAPSLRADITPRRARARARSSAGDPSSWAAFVHGLWHPLRRLRPSHGRRWSSPNGPFPAP